MGKCQPAKIARSARRLLASRWKLAGGRLLMSLRHLTQEQQVSPINLLQGGRSRRPQRKGGRESLGSPPTFCFWFNSIES